MNNKKKLDLLSGNQRNKKRLLKKMLCLSMKVNLMSSVILKDKYIKEEMWRRSKEEFRKQNLLSTVKHGGEGVIV